MRETVLVNYLSFKMNGGRRDKSRTLSNYPFNRNRFWTLATLRTGPVAFNVAQMLLLPT